MVNRRRRAPEPRSLFSSQRVERTVDKAVDAGIVLGTLYVGAGMIGSIAGAFRHE